MGCPEAGRELSHDSEWCSLSFPRVFFLLGSRKWVLYQLSDLNKARPQGGISSKEKEFTAPTAPSVPVTCRGVIELPCWDCSLWCYPWCWYQEHQERGALTIQTWPGLSTLWEWVHFIQHPQAQDARSQQPWKTRSWHAETKDCAGSALPEVTGTLWWTSRNEWSHINPHMEPRALLPSWCTAVWLGQWTPRYLLTMTSFPSHLLLLKQKTRGELGGQHSSF